MTLFEKLARYWISGSKALLLLVLFTLSACVTTVEELPWEPPVFPSPPDEPRFVWERMIRGSFDVEQRDTESTWKELLTGKAEGGATLSKPYGVAVHKGRVFVGDTVARDVYYFDFPMGKFKAIGKKEGAGLLGKPLGLGVDAAGTLYITDATFKNVKIYTRDGEFIKGIGKKGDLKRPTGIAVTPDGTKVFVIDTGGVDTREHKVHVYDPRSGEKLYDFGTRGSNDGDFNLPNNATIGPADGLLYVTDGGNFRVQSFTQEGEFVKTYGGGIGRRTGQFSRPKGIAVDKDGNIYVADAAFGNFQIFNNNGDLLLAVGGRGRGGGPANYFLPAGLAVDEDGRVYMADQFFAKVGVYRPFKLGFDEGYLGSQGSAEEEEKEK